MLRCILKCTCVCFNRRISCCVRYQKVPIPDHVQLRNRPKFDLPTDAIVYACAQSNFKLHPDFDYTLAQILDSVPNSMLVMVYDRRDTWTHQVTSSIPILWRLSVHF